MSADPESAKSSPEKPNGKKFNQGPALRISDADAAYADIIDVDPKWNLWVLCGFGWVADQMLLQMLAVIQPRTKQEFGLSGCMFFMPVSLILYVAGLLNKIYTVTSGGTQACYFAGLSIGATFWGVGADAFGRKLAFNITLLTAGVFSTALAGQMGFGGLGAIALLMGTGTGGNLPLDGAIYLEASPKKDQRVLMLMSAFWCFGQFFASVIGYAVIPGHSCADDAVECNLADNRGWRWACITLGGFTLLMWSSRFFLFTFYESPKYLLSIGNLEKAARNLNGIAEFNKSPERFDVNDFEHRTESADAAKKGYLTVFKEQMAVFGPKRIKPLFSTKKMTLTTLITWFLWIDIQIGYSMFNGFLPAYLEKKGADVSKTLSETYLEYVWISLCGIPGAFLAMYFVEIKYIGRKGTMALSAAGSALCLVLFAYLTSSGGQLAAGCIQSFAQNIFYAVLYAYSPEVFPTYVRGTAVGIASMLARVVGAVWVPLATGYLVNISVNIPLIWSAVCFGLLAPAALLLPVETMGKHAM